MKLSCRSFVWLYLDYLVIEALLDIVGWLIPITNQTEKGTVKRTEFINNLFGSDKHFSCSSELVNTLQYISSSHWEDTVMKIMDTLARSDITLWVFRFGNADQTNPLIGSALNHLPWTKSMYAANVILNRLHLTACTWIENFSLPTLLSRWLYLSCCREPR